MQTIRYQRLARQLNQTALALMTEARFASPNEAKELRELATEIDRVRVSMFAEKTQIPELVNYPRIEAA